MNKLLSNSRLFLKRNSSTILTCAGAVGVIATTVSAVKATPKAIALMELAKEEKGEDLTKTEVVLAAAPAYIPTVLLGASTIACIFGANMLNKRNQAALMSAYALIDNSYKEYKAKVEELYGEEADAEVKMQIAKDKYDCEVSMVESSGEKRLFFDFYSGRYFESTIEAVQRAQYNINRKMNTRDYAYLNDWYDELGIERVAHGYTFGWSGGACFDLYWQNWIDFTHEVVDVDDGLECTIISFYTEPIPDFETYC